MDRFGRALRRVEDRLEVGEPERSRILLELAVDLEGLYRTYRERGCSEEEALKRAEGWLVPDEGSLGELRRVHAGTPARLLDLLTEIGGSGFATAALTVLSLLVVAGGLGGLWSGTTLRPGLPAAGVVAVAAVGAVLAGRRAASFLGPSGPETEPEGWLPGLLAAAAGCGVAGALGACFEVARALGSTAGDAAVAVPWAGVASAASTAALGLVGALALALAWFWLVVRLGVIRRARAELERTLASLEASPGEGA